MPSATWLTGFVARCRSKQLNEALAHPGFRALTRDADGRWVCLIEIAGKVRRFTGQSHEHLVANVHERLREGYKVPAQLELVA